MSLWRESEAGGLAFGSSTTSGLERLRAAPPYPGNSIVAPALVPPPPFLDADTTDRGRVMALIQAYRGAAENRTRRRCFMLGTGDPMKSRFVPILLGGAAALIAHRIAPAAWAAWSIDLWRRDDQKQLPPISFVYGKNRIAQRRGWFRSEATAYMGGQAIYGEKHRELLTRWNSMACALYRLDDPRKAAVVVERFFPRATFDELVREAEVESAAKTRELRICLEGGAWLW